MSDSRPLRTPNSASSGWSAQFCRWYKPRATHRMDSMDVRLPSSNAPSSALRTLGCDMRDAWRRAATRVRRALMSGDAVRAAQKSGRLEQTSTCSIYQQPSAARERRLRSEPVAWTGFCRLPHATSPPAHFTAFTGNCRPESPLARCLQLRRKQTSNGVTLLDLHLMPDRPCIATLTALRMR